MPQSKKLKIFHNSKCSKCRGTLELIENSKIPYEIINYLETPPSAEELDSLLKMLGMEPEQLVRKGEDRYEELSLDSNPPRTRDAWIQVLIQNPILIERPIVTDGKRAVLGRPPENVKTLL